MTTGSARGSRAAAAARTRGARRRQPLAGSCGARPARAWRSRAACRARPRPRCRARTCSRRSFGCSRRNLDGTAEISRVAAITYAYLIGIAAMAQAKAVLTRKHDDAGHTSTCASPLVKQAWSGNSAAARAWHRPEAAARRRPASNHVHLIAGGPRDVVTYRTLTQTERSAAP
jgi:hypothetical protein